MCTRRFYQEQALSPTSIHTHHRKWAVVTGACGAQVALRSVTDSKSSQWENKLLRERTSSEVDSGLPSDISFIRASSLSYSLSSLSLSLILSFLTDRILYSPFVCMEFTMLRERVGKVIRFYYKEISWLEWILTFAPFEVLCRAEEC